MKRLNRLVSLALLLSARRRLTADEAARHYGISVRTVYRDLAALEDAGFPLTGTPGDGYTLAEGAQLKGLAITPDEAEALVLAARVLQRDSDEVLAGTLQGAVAKLESTLSIDARRRLKTSRATIRVGKSEKKPGPLSLLLDAVHSRRVLKLTYDGINRGETTEREVEPLGLLRFTDSWLMPAWCRLRGEVRVFRSDRVRKAVPTGETFVEREGFTMADLVKRHAEQQAARATG
ncbi:MAG: helix-turn-helix transcriptional regulator [Archangium sp.]